MDHNMLLPQLNKQRQRNIIISSLQSECKSLTIVLSMILLFGTFGSLLVAATQFLQVESDQANSGRELQSAQGLPSVLTISYQFAMDYQRPESILFTMDPVPYLSELKLSKTIQITVPELKRTEQMLTMQSVNFLSAFGSQIASEIEKVNDWKADKIIFENQESEQQISARNISSKVTYAFFMQSEQGGESAQDYTSPIASPICPAPLPATQSIPQAFALPPPPTLPQTFTQFRNPLQNEIKSRPLILPPAGITSVSLAHVQQSFKFSLQFEFIHDRGHITMTLKNWENFKQELDKYQSRYTVPHIQITKRQFAAKEQRACGRRGGGVVRDAMNRCVHFFQKSFCVWIKEFKEANENDSIKISIHVTIPKVDSNRDQQYLTNITLQEH